MGAAEGLADGDAAVLDASEGSTRIPLVVGGADDPLLVGISGYRFRFSTLGFEVPEGIDGVRAKTSSAFPAR